MEIAFRTKALRNICENGDAMQSQYGAEGAQRIKQCLADLRAATSLGELPMGLPSAPLGDWTCEASIVVDKKRRLVLRPNHNRMPVSQDDSVDWNSIERVLVLRIEVVSD